MGKTLEKNNKYRHVKNNAQNAPLLSSGLLEKFRLVLLALLAVIIFYPPYLRGLYFETEQLPAEILIFTVYIAFLVYKYLKHDKKFVKTPLEYIAFGFVIVYFISILSAVGTREAIGEWLKYCMYFAVFIMLSELLSTYKSKIISLWVLIASALGVSIIGIDGIAGGKFTNVLNGIFKIFGAKQDLIFGIFVGNRINSTFQYPNATAAYLMAIFFVSVAILMMSKKVYSKFIAAISSYIILVAFMLTLSRGAMVFMPIAAIFYVVLQPNGYRIKSIFSVIPAGIGMLATVTKLSDIMAAPQGNEINVWKYFILGIVITIVIQTLLAVIDIYVQKVIATNETLYKKVKFSGYILCGLAALLVIAGIVLAVATKEPLSLSHADGQADSNKNIRRSFTLEPDKEYKLVYDVQSDNSKNKPNAYTIIIASRNFSGIINAVDTAITSISGNATNGAEQREQSFKVPADSKSVSITFGNYYEGTSVVFKDAKIIPVNANDKGQAIALKYKFIPESLYARVDEVKETKSGIERTIFAKDGFEIFKDHPILGGGGGSWPLQYFAHQSYLYWTTQAHNYPIQVAVETGILGTIVLVGLWIVVAFQVIQIIRKGKKNNGVTGILNAGVMAGSLALLLHSCMDFDLSLSSIYLVLWELLAIINSDILYNDEIAEFEEGNKWINKFVNEIKAIYLHPGLALLVAIVIITFPVMFIGGINNSNAASSLKSQNDLPGILTYISKAMASDPFSPKYKADYINLVLNQDQKKITQADILKTTKYANSIEKAAENNADIALSLSTYYLRTGSYDKGMHYLERVTQLKPFVPDSWNQKAEVLYQIALAYKKSGDDKTADKNFNEILNIADEVKKASQRSMISFTMSPSTMEVIEKVKLLKDNKTSLSESISSRSVFYALNNYDIDGNGIPDEWNDTNKNDVKLQVSGNTLTAETQNGKQGVLQSRGISLNPGKTYVISIELENAKDIAGNVMVTLSGQNDPIKLTKNGTTYTAEISTGSGGNIGPVSLGIVVDGKYVIKDARVVEK